MALIADAVAMRESRQAGLRERRPRGRHGARSPDRAGPIRAGDNDFRCRRPRCRRRRRRRAGTPSAPTWSVCATSTSTASRVSAPTPTTRTRSATAPTRPTRASSPALAFLAGGPPTPTPCWATPSTSAALNLAVMAMLDAANTGSFGNPVPTPVRVTPVAGKAILVSGHDLHDLAKILEATEGTGINVYTHGELLPAHGYPELHKYSHLAGNYGGAWQDQQRDFTAFPGPIVMTSNCLIEPQPAYRNRIFTVGPVGWPGVRHLGHRRPVPGGQGGAVAARLRRRRAGRDGHHRVRPRRGARRSPTPSSRRSKTVPSNGSCSSAAATARRRAATTTPTSPTMPPPTPC